MDDSESVDLLKQARARFTQQEIASKLDVDVRTIRRWEVCQPAPPSFIADVLKQRIFNSTSNKKPENQLFTFIDLFAGIGGIRLGFEEHGGKCIFTSEWNQFAQKTYLEQFPSNNNHQLVGDITKIDANEIPDHDLLLAGFPCQPFSIAGVSKKNSLGRPHGFECATQGTLFFDVARIIATKRPRAFMLENVKNLLSHDKGNTFKVIIQTLRDELGYDVKWKIIDGQHFVPQHRERIIITGFREKSVFTWDDLKLPEKEKNDWHQFYIHRTEVKRQNPLTRSDQKQLLTVNIH